MLVAELRRVTVLWDELWLGVLLQQHMYVLRRIQQLEDEVKRVQNNNTLRKYVFGPNQVEIAKRWLLERHAIKMIKCCT
mgnify:CR=1 FL=1